jgi:hypothetical protein
MNEGTGKLRSKVRCFETCQRNIFLQVAGGKLYDNEEADVDEVMKIVLGLH